MGEVQGACRLDRNELLSAAMRVAAANVKQTHFWIPRKRGHIRAKMKTILISLLGSCFLFPSSFHKVLTSFKHKRYMVIQFGFKASKSENL